MISYIKRRIQAEVFESRILRRIYGPKMDEIGEWGRLHNDELHSLYHSHNIVRVIKSKIKIVKLCRFLRTPMLE